MKQQNCANEDEYAYYNHEIRARENAAISFLKEFWLSSRTNLTIHKI